MSDPRQFWDDLVTAPISHGAFRVVHALNQYANRRGFAWPSARTIAKDIGADRKSVMRWLVELEAAEIVSIKRKMFRSSTVKLEKLPCPSKGPPVSLKGATSGINSPTNYNVVKKADDQRPALPYSQGVPLSPPPVGSMAWHMAQAELKNS